MCVRSLNITIKIRTCFLPHRRNTVLHYIFLTYTYLTLGNELWEVLHDIMQRDSFLSVWGLGLGNYFLSAAVFLDPGLPNIWISKLRAAFLFSSQQNAHPS